MTAINGYCLPASCSPQMVLDFLNERFLNQNDLQALSTTCRTNDPYSFEIIDVVAM